MINNTNPRAYRYTILVVNLLEKLLRSRITFENIENIPAKPVLFVANHFTRLETILVPYLIYKQAKRQVRCLADESLFHGTLGRFLQSVGALSTKDQNRDLAIISDLVNGSYDWMIYPEGRMVKNKDNYDNIKSLSSPFSIFGSKGEDRIRTGSAVLALKSELYRMELISAKRTNDINTLDYYKKNLLLEFDEKLIDMETNIVPLNITYYPIRPGKNIIQTIANKIFKKLPGQAAEELEIEGNLLLSSDMHISFAKPISVAAYIKNAQNTINKIPVISNKTKTDLVVKYLKNRLTSDFMDVIYSNTQINIDHIVAAIFYFYPHNQIDPRYLKSLIYLSINQIINLKKYHLNHTISAENIHRLLIDENHEQFLSIISLAKTLGIITQSEDGQTYFVNQDKLEQQYDFQQIRRDNTLRVIFNEFLLLEKAVNIVKRNVLDSEEMVRESCFHYLIAKDLEIFDKDYVQYYDPKLSKDKTIGSPLFLDNINSAITKKDGILLVHGYLSAPREMEEMAKYLNNLGYKTYSARLKGHGTAPVNLEDAKWQDWYDGLSFGYEALKLVCNKVFIVGFSTGGLLSMVASTRKYQIDAIVCINPALKLKDMRTKFAFGIHIWNDLLEKCRIDAGQLRYVENHSESPEINYSLNYINGIEQLELLMSYCEKILEKVLCPVLTIQSTKDPVVNATSTRQALDKIGSNSKKFIEIESEKHIIVTGYGDNKNSLDKVCAEVVEFLKD